MTVSIYLSYDTKSFWSCIFWRENADILPYIRIPVMDFITEQCKICKPLGII